MNSPNVFDVHATSPMQFGTPSIEAPWVSTDNALHQVKEASSLGAWMLDTALDVPMSQLQSTQVYLRI
ncbi:hypothetical protein SPRG_04981 [Saprolegnia parasitica CBS 223.65]|uniref:Uncharacterized protein n=1 Tax=Saprolegnia parasitica (strain CBS 223.65) TaxID=695850 RepID=A0A067CL22_SAPPC|nr:hypothetical protein SPRG_04981 [Saprolegnia parasitica CBS 223.65]KDO29915.1 hypothetical protein SPRG_04981 [Saprolegnia parasitica CBS 223.65]|eukprot:XP_012199509.1 hypothetical protein SPRG_04981 [Saprolegnia parasitica CBS 223.65]